MRDRISRRGFVRKTALGAIGAGMAIGAGGALAQDAAAPKIVKKGDMVFRRLGRTELMVSELSIGGSPSPDPAIFSEALDKGMNLVDTSAFYAGGEERIGEVTEGRREDCVICTKTMLRGMDDRKAGMIQACDTALGKLKTDYIDIFCVHAVGDPSQFLDDGIQAGYDALREAGKIRFAGASCHQNPVGVLTPLIESGRLDVAVMAFSAFSGTTVTKESGVHDDFLADSGLQGILDKAVEADVGIIAMKTMAGGARQKLDAYQTGDTTLAQAKIKWVLSHEAVASALSEVLSYEFLEENLGAVGQTLTPDDQAMLRGHIEEMSASVCRMCGTCVGACPRSVPIPDILRCVTYRDAHGKPARAARVYRDSVGPRVAAACGDCAKCMQTCPHGIDIRAQMERAEKVFT